MDASKQNMYVSFKEGSIREYLVWLVIIKEMSVLMHHWKSSHSIIKVSVLQILFFLSTGYTAVSKQAFNCRLIPVSE